MSDVLMRDDRVEGAGKPTTTRRSRARMRRKDPLWAKLLVIGGALLMVVAGAGIVAKNAVFSYATKSVAQENLLGDSGTRTQQKGHVSITGAKTILLIGIDARPNRKPTDLIRADSIIILHIPAGHDSAYLVSIPRDTVVKIPAYNNGAQKFLGQTDKINAAYALGGQGLTGAAQRKNSVTLLAQTINKLWGVTFDGAAIVDFTGFQDVVKALGGVDMYVDQETTSVHIGHDKRGVTKVPFIQTTRSDGGTKLTPVAGVTPVVYHVGQQHLAAWQALDYVRQRELLPNSDYDRQRHQQQFLKAVFKEMLSSKTLTNPVKFNHVVDVVGKAMTIDSGGIDLADWAFAMRDIGSDDLVTLKTNNGTFHAADDANGEALDQTTVDLLDAVRTDAVQPFVAAHPDLITKND
jgi:polyisoprenyl-teichoic acid--peptidoglycan teichoic acid transferase